MPEFETLIEDFAEKLEVHYTKIDPNTFNLNISDDIQIKTIGIPSLKQIYFYSNITACPTEKRELIFTHLMKANLLGDGTGGATIGLDNDEKFLTLSYVMPYESNYENFKEQLEDFVNYLLFWEEEIKKLSLEKNLLG